MQHGININYAGLSPQDKLQILTEMGFREIPPSEHGTNCTSRQGRGLVCNCLQGVTTWGAPLDVKGYLGETHDQRVEFAVRRQMHQNEGVGENPGSWMSHLERTAPRYNS